eukprot:UC1_evm1s1188
MDREKSALFCAEWLENKLVGDIGWESGNISTLLTPQTLEQVSICFTDLKRPTIKVKVLLALLLMRREDFSAGLKHIIDIAAAARADSDDWVRLTSQLVGDYARDRTLRPD